MYFAPAQARAVTSRLTQCLNDGGYLVPAASEASSGLFAPLIAAPLPGVILYQKTSVAPRLESDFASREVSAPAKAALPTTQPRISTSNLTSSKPVSTTKPKIALPVTPVAANLNPNVKPADAWYEQARAAAGTGQLDEALSLCDKAIEADKMTARNYYLRASILLEKEPLSAENDSAAADNKNSTEREAEIALRNALYLEPDFALAHFVLGNLERRRGRADAAHRSWQNALRVLQNLAPDAPLDGGDELTAGHAAAMIERALHTLADTE